jgi:hypothetical protein
MLSLDRVIDEFSRVPHTGNCADPMHQVGRNSRHLGEGASCVALHDPQIGANTINQKSGVLDDAAINPGHPHDDHQQHADPHRGQHESAQVMPDVFQGQVHGA